jgi:hypothetical protein
MVEKMNESAQASSSGPSMSGESGRIAQIEAMVARMRRILVVEAKRRKLDKRVVAEATRARDVLAKQMATVRTQGVRLAAEINRMASENQILGQARTIVFRKAETWRAELNKKGGELRRTSAELADLARDSVTRAWRIVRHGQSAAQNPEQAGATGLRNEQSPDEKSPDEKPFSGRGPSA